MNVGTLNGKTAEVNGTKSKSLRTGREYPIDSKRAEQGQLSLLGFQFVYMVFSATILRPLTSARNYATIADRKSKFGGLEKVSFKADNYSEEIAGKK